MKRSEWSDKQLEELLRQLPNIQDHRNPRDIYQNLSLKKRNYRLLLPGIATAAVLVIILILAPKLMSGPQYSSDQAGKEQYTVDKKFSLSEKNKDLTKESKQDSTSKSTEKSIPKMSKLMVASTGLKTAVYDEEVGNGTVLTYWIPDPQAQILIPVSTIIHGHKDKSWLTLFTENMAGLTEKDWGLSDYYPVNATFKLDDKENSVVVDVPANNPYMQGETSVINFVNVIKKDVSSNSKVRKIKLSTNGQPGIQLGQYGEKKELNIETDKNHAYLFYIPVGKDIPLLAPSLNMFKDIKSALEAMKTGQPEIGLKASLNQAFQLKYTAIKDGTLFVTIDKNTKMEDNPNVIYSLEALLLTAKEFGVNMVKVENAPINQVGRFDLTKKIKVPVAPNLRNIQ
ncbi:hypothetical protein [Neobacillus ginsengisoli]|uniref:Negative regulator of sigma-X activity n=1 Tax=Neobacillus ginsengisoli TaxID=904295 RepID=A0ABT9XR88_9BACI|nr:hypothetical protein [Neobacillus ginsengisoli]MDQ0197457.1 hypothetical protein [Neobacillus ginsengisoli]